LTRRERMLVTLRHGKADMVPCCPDFSVMIPLKLKKRPFWEAYIDEKEGIFYDLWDNENLFNAYIDAVKYFGTVAWAIYAGASNEQSTFTSSDTDRVKYESKIIEKRSDRRVVRTTMITPEGNLWSETVYPIYDPPFPHRKFIKDFKKEFRFLKYFYSDPKNLDFSKIARQREIIGDMGVNGVGVLPPSLVHLDAIVDGGLGKIGLVYYDYPELISQYKEMHEEWSMEYLRKLVEARCCDEIITGGSGLMTWQSPKITRDLSLDGLKKITKICKENNLISHLHCCGFSKELVKMCAEETDLDVIEPLEPPPQGDVDLKEIKEKYGKKLVLKGNLQTSRVMLSDVKTVEREAIKCIEDAGEGGGFVLSTGDQCGRDTPHENIFKLVEVCEKYGKY
jgi:uroporphyrinogen decarboxylase